MSTDGSPDRKRLLHRYILVSAVVGAAAEGIAGGLSLWRFTPKEFAVVQILLFEGLIMGGLAFATRERGLAVRFAAGFIAGTCGELLNEFIFHNWTITIGDPSSAWQKWGVVGVVFLLWGLYIPVVDLIVKRLPAKGEKQGENRT